MLPANFYTYITLMFGLIPTSLVVRKISDTDRSIFLTFDDGPTPDFTERVLDTLAEEGAKATFFVIGRRATKHIRILRRILAESHSVFSHSTDHNFLHYFRTPGSIKAWVSRSLAELEDLTGMEQRMFRPPGGFVPPPLYMAARSLRVPIVLWNHRFYDWVHPWTAERAQASLERARPGDIVLLHDQQKEPHRPQFIRTLRDYVRGLRVEGLEPATLSNSRVVGEAFSEEAPRGVVARKGVGG